MAGGGERVQDGVLGSGLCAQLTASNFQGRRVTRVRAAGRSPQPRAVAAFTPSSFLRPWRSQHGPGSLAGKSLLGINVLRQKRPMQRAGKVGENFQEAEQGKSRAEKGGDNGFGRFPPERCLLSLFRTTSGEVSQVRAQGTIVGRPGGPGGENQLP